MKDDSEYKAPGSKPKNSAPVRVQPVVGRRLAQRIARKLFTPGGERRMVDHLRLMRGEKSARTHTETICGMARASSATNYLVEQCIRQHNLRVKERK